MLYRLLYPLRTSVSAFNVTGYITFRTAAASLTALAISLALGPWLITKLREFQIGQVIRHEGPATHAPKAGTPTMGGILIVISTLLPTFLWADLRNPFVWIALLSTTGFGAIGFVDDYIKVVRRRSLGLTGKIKLLLQFGISFFIGLALVYLNTAGRVPPWIWRPRSSSALTSAPSRITLFVIHSQVRNTITPPSAP